MLFSTLCEEHQGEHRHRGDQLESLPLPEVLAIVTVVARAIGLLHGHLILELLELLVPLLPHLQRQASEHSKRSIQDFGMCYLPFVQQLIAKTRL